MTMMIRRLFRSSSSLPCATASSSSILANTSSSFSTVVCHSSKRLFRSSLSLSCATTSSSILTNTSSLSMILDHNTTNNSSKRRDFHHSVRYRKPLGGITSKDGWLPEVRVAAPNYNRWRAAPMAVASHICLGSVYSWSMLNDPLTKVMGVVVSAPQDWTLYSVMGVFSTILVLQGLSAAVVGKWQQRVGGRASGMLGGLLFGGGFILGGIGVLLHNLPLLYVGFGFISGCGIGCAYVPPVANLLAFFPDRRGLATGMTITGFGGGALISTPAMRWLLQHFSQPPEYAGKVDDASVVVRDGRRFVEVSGEMREVVEATANDLFDWPTLSEGLYVVGTGSSGAGMTLITLGTVYTGIMVLAANSYRVPSSGYKPAGAGDAAKNSVAGASSWDEYVPVDAAVRTPQFWQVWVTFGCLSTAGMAVVSVAKNMMLEVFAGAYPLIVTTSFASGYIMALSAANLLGRLGWSTLSDRVGRQRLFTAFAVTSVPLYLLIPKCVDALQHNNGEVWPLAVFYGSTFVIFSFFGASYATTPAYESDLFGTKEVGAIHGRMLTASSVASLAGPMGVTWLRGMSEATFIRQLVSLVPDDEFQRVFHSTKEHLNELIENKTVTINILMRMVPEGTVDPSPYLYNTTMQSAAALLVLAAVSNALIRPVHRSCFTNTTTAQVAADGREEEKRDDDTNSTDARTTKNT